MPKCCVKGCGTKYSKKAPLISLHKLPNNESLQKKWLESLGQENIDSTQEHAFICSLHFEESCINRTLDIVRLKDNAIPTRLPKTNQEPCKTTASTAGSKNNIVLDVCMANPELLQPVTSTTTNPCFEILKKFKDKCAHQQKKIKRLNAKCRRQAKKLAVFSHIIQDLKQINYINNESAIMLEECSGPKDFL